MSEQARVGDRLSRLRLEPGERRGSSPRRAVTLIGVVIVLFFAALVALAVLASGRGEDAPAASRAASAPTAPESPPSRAQATTSEAVVAAGGYIEARRSAPLRPGRDGVVKAVHVTLGQSVQAGDLVLELENDTLQAELEMAEAELALADAQLQAVRAGSRVEEVQAADSESEAAEASAEEARQELTRLLPLSQQGVVSEAEVDRARQRARAAEARLQALRARERMVRRGSLPTDIAIARARQEHAQAALRRAQAALELTRLRAPFGGVIVARDVEPGEVVSLQDAGRPPMIELADTAELWARVDIPESRITQIRAGAGAEVVVDALGDGRRLEGAVVEIAPLADRQSNTISVAVRVAEPPPQLRPNMSARVFIQVRPGQEER